jgi:phosphoglycolate phosphatase
MLRTRFFRQIVWDWNGTLLDDVGACINAINRLVSRRGLATVTVEAYRDGFAFPVKQYYRRLGFDLATEDWDALAREFHDAFLSDPSIRLQPAARECLETLQRRGYRQSVLSASEQSILSDTMGALDVTAFFDEIHGLNDLYAHSKLELGRCLLDALPLPPEVTLLIGDTTHDHEVAEALGLRCLLVADGHQSRARLEQCGAPIVAGLDQVVAWIDAYGERESV